MSDQEITYEPDGSVTITAPVATGGSETATGSETKEN